MQIKLAFFSAIQVCGCNLTIFNGTTVHGKPNSAVKHLALALCLAFCICLLVAIPQAYSQNPTVELTDQEKAWLAEHRDLKVGVDPYWPPFDFVSPDGKTHQGMASDVIASLNKRLGINMKMVPGLNWRQVMDGMKNRTIDMAACLTETPERRKFLNFTRAYLNFPLVAITRKDHPIVSGLEDFYGKKVVVVDGYALQERIKTGYPGVIIMTVKTPLDGLKAVSTGLAEAYAGNLAVASYAIAEHHLANLKIAAPVSFRSKSGSQSDNSSRLRIGVRKDWPLLVSILDKGIQSISPVEWQEIKSKWFSVRFEHKVSNQRLIEVSLQVGLVAAVFLGLVLYWNRRLKGEIVQRKQAQTELLSAKGLAEDASRAKSEFLANMSHEIRTPLNVITGMNTLVLDSNLEPQQRENLESVQVASEHLMFVINEILDISKIEAGRMELEKLAYNLPNTVGHLVKDLAVSARDKGLGLHSHIDQAIPAWIWGDLGRLRQILLNLGNNAIKFTDQGEVVFRMERVGVEDQRVMVRFEISDTGVGIQPSHIKKIFEPFTQADASTTRKYGGTGLGLSISGKLIAMMGGRLYVESRPGSGSTFSFTLPVEEAPAGKDMAPKDLELSKTEDLPGLKILVAEDVRLNQKLATQLLVKLGHEVTLADDGQQAVEAFDRQEFDLILMDVQMPGLDGLEATRIIRKQEKNKPGRTPIIALTAHAMESDRQRCLAAGMDSYLSKPLQLDALKAALQNVAIAKKLA